MKRIETSNTLLLPISITIYLNHFIDYIIHMYYGKNSNTKKNVFQINNCSFYIDKASFSITNHEAINDSR